jgi:hypothetical protein
MQNHRNQKNGTQKAFLFSQSLKDKKTNRLNGVKNKIRRNE